VGIVHNQKGYKLEFLEKPKFTGVRPTVVQSKDQELILKEIETLLQKDAIEKEGFLQYLLPGSTKERTNASSVKPQTLKEVSRQKALQNGHIDKSDQHGETNRLGIHNRLGRCIPSHSTFSQTSKVSLFLFQRPMLSVEGNVF